jgi:hypothetical protein
MADYSLLVWSCKHLLLYFTISWKQYKDWNAGFGMVKSPFEKGGLRGISGGYFKSPLPPFFKGGLKNLSSVRCALRTIRF